MQAAPSMHKDRALNEDRVGRAEINQGIVVEAQKGLCPCVVKMGSLSPNEVRSVRALSKPRSCEISVMSQCVVKIFADREREYWMPVSSASAARDFEQFGLWYSTVWVISIEQILDESGNDFAQKGASFNSARPGRGSKSAPFRA